MKKLITAVVVLSFVSGAALAQATSKEQGATGGAAAAAGAATGAVGGAIVGGPVGAAVGAVGGAVVGAITGSAVTPEDRVYVREYAVKHRHPTVAVREPVVIGKPLPGAVTTYVIEDRPSLKGYRYAYVNNQYLLIDSRGNVVGAVE